MDVKLRHGRNIPASWVHPSPIETAARRLEQVRLAMFTSDPGRKTHSATERNSPASVHVCTAAWPQAEDMTKAMGWPHGARGRRAMGNR
jgi:hypothetical protein